MLWNKHLESDSVCCLNAMIDKFESTSRSGMKRIPGYDEFEDRRLKRLRLEEDHKKNNNCACSHEAQYPTADATDLFEIPLRPLFKRIFQCRELEGSFVSLRS